MSETEAVRLRDLPPDQRREAFLDQLYAKLDDPDLPAHVYGRITSSITAIEKVIAQDGEEGERVAADLGPALHALPVDHATEILVDHVRRLRAEAGSYADQLAGLIGDDAAAQALEGVA